MRLDHAIFKGPLQPELDRIELDTPENYSHYPAGADLPKQLDAWLVQTVTLPEIGPGLVVDSFGFEDSPDAEWISGGTNSKGPTSLALGRQANIFMWGFFADPTLMTESGRRVFLNSICYISKFAGERPLLARKAPARERVFLYMHYVRERADSPRTQEIVEQLFPADLLERTQYDADAMTAHYSENLEFLRRSDGRFVVDEDLRALGVSNREFRILVVIAKRLSADSKDELARKLIERYIDPAIAPQPDKYAAWLKRRLGELYFSDVGGFRWFSSAIRVQPVEVIAQEYVQASLIAQPRTLAAGSTTELLIRLELDGGWHTYAPRSKGGFPLNVEFDLPEDFELVGELQVPEGFIQTDAVLGTMEGLEGEITLRQRVRVPASSAAGEVLLEARVNVTVCDALQCLPPQELALSVSLQLED